ncbi:heavy metal translocating P-type ATPase [Halobacteriaceae archaeon GCM10025711]
MTSCDLCDLPTPDPPVTDSDVDGEFCCRGCLEVTRTLGDVDEAEPEDIRRALGADQNDEPIPDGTEETFLAVEGMHCSTCEAFIEGTAGASEGIHAAEASYASNVVKLTYDPDDIGRDELPGVINGLGYTAREIDEADEGRQETIGRLLVGGFFGMMVMLWYILFLYPAYVGVPPEDLLLDLTGPAGSYLLGNVWVMTSVVLFYTGFPILRGAYVSLLSGHPNMDLLIAIAAVNAYVYSTLAMLVGMVDVYFDIAVVIVVVVTLGNYYEDRLKRKAVGLLSELTEERVDEARIRTEDGTETVPIEAVRPGDTLVVKPGERVPLDGTVVEGTAAVDESLITGESLPVRKEPGDEVIGGGVVADSALVVAVDEDAGSTLDRLVTLLWDIQSSKPGAQRLADRIAAVFVPLVIIVAVVAFGWQLFTGATPTGALLVGLAVLVVSCPCALGLATPLATASGVHTALDEGIIVGDGSVFETSEEVEYVAFDKTGTLTTGEMQVVEATGDERTLERAAAVEQFSEHPVASAVTAHTSPPDAEVTGFERHPGKGVSAEVDGDRVVVGVPSLVEHRGWTVADDHAAQVTAAQEQGNVASVVAWDGASRGVVVAGDTPREEWESVVAELAADGKKVVVITGDSERAAARFREREDVEHVFAGVPPEAKAQVVERLQADGPTAMVGDGSNDAPALAAADLGIAMESGTALAADAADAIVTTDDLATVPRVFELTAATNGRIKQNLGWAFLYNAIAIPLAVAGAINPLLAAVAMSASSLLVVGNSSRNL